MRQRSTGRTVLLVALLALAAGCERERSGDPWETVDLAEIWTTATRGVGLLDQREFVAAAEAWTSVVEAAPFWYTARVNLGIALLNETSTEDEARRVFEEVLAELPETPWAHYCLGIIDEQSSDLEGALEHYRAVLAVDPDDPDTHLRTGLVLTTLGRADEAVRHLQTAVGFDPEVETGWFALAQAAREAGDDDLHAQAMERFAALKQGAGGEERSIVYGKMGFYADPIRSDGWDLPRPPQGPAPEAYAVVLVDGSADAGLTDEALRHGGPGEGFFTSWVSNATVTRQYAPEVSGGVSVFDFDTDGDMDVFAAHWGEGPDVLALDNDGAGVFRDRAAELGLDGNGPARTIAVAAADLDGDGTNELFLGRDGPDRIASASAPGEPFERAIEGAAGPDEPTLSVAVGDMDLDGDLDLLVGRHSDVALYRWNGTRFDDVTDETRAHYKGPVFGVVLADVDGDHDVDPINGAPKVRVGLNERLWQLRESEVAEFGARTTVASFSVGDVDRDGRLDWLLSNPSEPTKLYRGSGAGYVLDQRLEDAGVPSAFSSFFVDIDRDGDLDVLTVGEEPGLFLQDGDTWSSWTDESGLGAIEPELADARGSVPFDADGDGDLDLFVVRNGDTPLFVRNDTDTGPGDDWIAVTPRGIADRVKARGRTLGPGTEVEVVANGVTRRDWAALGGGFASVAPETLWFNLAGASRADVRLRWPDLVLQTELDQAGGELHVIEQVDREASSCPVAFTWDGERWAYRADFLGSGGLGFLVAPGVYGRPDPTDVLRLGTDLAPRDGALELRVTEPMEEVSFLDRAELVEVVHPPGTIAYPEERFATDGRLPSGRVLVVREEERAFPVSARVVALEELDERRHVATDPQEADVATRLAVVDRSFAGPLALHRRLLGYAARFALEVEVPADELRALDDLCLFANGWIEYPYSRLNYAAWQEGLTAEPPSLDVADGEGGWRRVRPTFGYMGGKGRTLVLPLGDEIRDWLPAATTNGRVRFRLVTNLPVFVDELFLAPDRSSTDLVRLRRHDPLAAEVGFCGFPRVHSPDGSKPDVYDFTERDTESDFKVFPGEYTHHGDALGLVTEADDRFAIFGRGEEVLLRFPAAEDVPDGALVTWMLDARGYCKDMCPLSSNPTHVDPLPFAAMGDYPPAEPLGEAHPSRAFPNGRRAGAAPKGALAPGVTTRR